MQLEGFHLRASKKRLIMRKEMEMQYFVKKLKSAGKIADTRF